MRQPPMTGLHGMTWHKRRASPSSRTAPYLSLRKSQTKEARILPFKGRLGFSRSRATTTPQTCLMMRHTLSMRFAASEPATNKALQEVRVLGGFGLLVTDKNSSKVPEKGKSTAAQLVSAFWPGWQPCGNHAGSALLPPQAAAPDLRLLRVAELRRMARQAGLRSLARQGRRAELLAALVACDKLETCL